MSNNEQAIRTYGPVYTFTTTALSNGYLSVPSASLTPRPCSSNSVVLSVVNNTTPANKAVAYFQTVPTMTGNPAVPTGPPISSLVIIGLAGNTETYTVTWANPTPFAV